MCSYIVEKTTLSGSAKGPNGWMHIDNANVYFDHPYHAPFDHALAIDFTCEADGGTEPRSNSPRCVSISPCFCLS